MRMIEGCEKGSSLKNGRLGCGVDIQRGNEALMWLAMELVYIDSANAQIRRHVYELSTEDGDSECMLV